MMSKQMLAFVYFSVYMSYVFLKDTYNSNNWINFKAWSLKKILHMDKKKCNNITWNMELFHPGRKLHLKISIKYAIHLAKIYVTINKMINR